MVTSPLMITADALWPPASATYFRADGSFAPGWPAPRDNILPGNATSLERAVADTDGRLDDIDMAFVSRVRDPAQTPAAILPYLAWERSVDVWDPAWPEDVQRTVVAVALIVHRYKGTRYGVRTALDALQVATRIVEWWETGPEGPPYTFEVTAYVRARLYDGDGPLVDARLIRVIYDTITRTKPLSRAFELRIGIGTGSPLGLAPIAMARGRMDLSAASARPLPALRSDLGLAPMAAVRNRVAVAAHALRPA